MGSKHAAKAGEAFAIDVEKLKATQHALRTTMGRPIAYAGHGGTGFKWEGNLIGSVFKRNINTQHLYAGTMSQFGGSTSTARASRTARRMPSAAAARSPRSTPPPRAPWSAEECQCWQRGPEFRKVLAAVGAKEVEFQDSNATE